MNARPLLTAAQLLELSPHDISIPERIGFLHEDKAAALGRLMAVDGQRDPIKVARNLPSKTVEACVAEGKKPWRLVTGMHRLMGATYESITVFAIEVKGRPEDLADLEASENLHRRPLGPIERAKFTAALVIAAQERIARELGDLDQYQRGAKARWDRVRHLEEGAEEALRDETEDACAKIAQAYGWEESVGEALGMSRRTIHNDLALYRLLIEPFPDLIYMLAQHPVVGENGSQLKELTRLKDEAVRRGVIEALLANNEIGVEDAKIAAGAGAAVPLATPVAHQKHYNAIEGAWSRLSLDQKRQFVPKLASMLTPDMKRALRDQLTEELGDAG
jgi:ParB family transcriptional regulator, chromosome partitioning protein